MSLSDRLQRLKPRHKFAALGVVAVAMVATPLVQVLRYQSAQLEAALYEQAGLDPIARAVALQWGLLAHRDIAGLVLNGVLNLEPERELRQFDVDNRLAALQETVIELKRERAIAETLALRQDWTALVPQVRQRRIKSPESDTAHRLLLEQALQVVDLVADASSLEPAGTRKTYLASVRELAALPHLALQIALLRAPAGAAAVSEREVAAAEAALARAMGHLNEGLALDAFADPALAAATALASATADRVFYLRRHPEAAPPPVLAAATAAALQAQVQLFDAAHATVTQNLALRKERVATERALLIALMLVLAGTAALLSLALRREWQALAAKTDEPPAERAPRRATNADGQTPRQAVAGRLWQRLRNGAGAAPGEAAAPTAPAAAPSQEPAQGQ